MTQPTVMVLGAYKFNVTDEEIKSFLQESFSNVMTPGEIEEQFALKQAELSSIVAFDVSVTNADENFDIGDFKQPDNDQVPYDEVYLSFDGRSVESETKPIDPRNFRVYFFLHFYDKNKPLISSYGQVEIPEIQALPEYLKSLHPYLPVD
jgi:hypothetical protein